jgi:hypothetical protein
VRRLLSLMLGTTLLATLFLSASPAIAGNPAGCTPGYWKQEQHFGNWQSPYDPGDLFDTYFENAFPGLTLLEVLQQGGGGLNALGRHVVAALLNSAIFNGPNDPGDYAYGVPGLNDQFTSTTEIINYFNAAYPGTRAEYIELKDAFAYANQRYCPLARAEL